MQELLGILALAAAGWYGWDTVRAKHIACRAGREACNRADVQFLDETVARRRLWFCRDTDGHLRLCRLYAFEFTYAGDRRYRGSVLLQGSNVSAVELEPFRL